MFEDQENIDQAPTIIHSDPNQTQPPVKPKPSQSEIVQIRINSFQTNPRHPVPQANTPSCSTFIDTR